MKSPQIFQKIPVKHIQALQIFDIIGSEMKIPDVLDYLLQSGHDSVTAIAGIAAVKHVKDHDLVRWIFKITLHHGQFVQIRQQGQIHSAHSMFSLSNCIGTIIALMKTVVKWKNLFIWQVLSCKNRYS